MHPPCSRARGHPPPPAVRAAAPIPVPVPPERSRSQKTSLLMPVQLCPALGARSPPQPVEGEQEVEGKKPAQRVQGCQRAPASPSHPPCVVAQAEAKPEAAGPLPGSAAALVLPGKAEEGKENSDPVSSPHTQRLLPGAVWLPRSRLESSCAKSTWPLLNVADTALPLPIWSLAG